MDARNRYYYARELYADGQTESALQNLLMFIKLPDVYFADKIQALILIARIYIKMQQPIGAMQYLTDTFLLDTPCSEACCLLGDCFLSQNLLDSAIFWYKAAMRCNNTVGFVNSNFSYLVPCVQLCMCFWKKGDVNRSLFWHNKCAKRHSDNETVIANTQFFVSQNLL